jgi:MoxR-like ATPase
MTLIYPDTMPVHAVSPKPPRHDGLLGRLRENLSRVLIGKAQAIDLFLSGVLSGGHILIEDVPGVGKTMLVKAFARAIGGKLHRIQRTPDLLPTDIIGVSIYNPKESAFQFKPGPLFSDLLLADEINRTSPRTQAALLEAMGEKQVTVDGQSLPLASSFCVIATQNPIEAQGTYSLPEAQLDRFAIQLSLGYPSASEARYLLLQPDDQQRLEDVESILGPAELFTLQQTAASIPIEDSVADYLLALVEATRCHPTVRLGVSPRGALAFLAVARGRALLHNRHFVTPDDVKSLAVATLAHRLILHWQAPATSDSKSAVVREILQQVKVPR